MTVNQWVSRTTKSRPTWTITMTSTTIANSHRTMHLQIRRRGGLYAITIKLRHLCTTNFMRYIHIFLQYGRFELQIVRLDLHLVTCLNHCSRNGQLFCPGKWWRRNNGEQLARAFALTRQWFESSVQLKEPPWYQVTSLKSTVSDVTASGIGRKKRRVTNVTCWLA